MMEMRALSEIVYLGKCRFDGQGAGLVKWIDEENFCLLRELHEESMKNDHPIFYVARFT